MRLICRWRGAVDIKFNSGNRANYLENKYILVILPRYVIMLAKNINPFLKIKRATRVTIDGRFCKNDYVEFHQFVA